MRKITNTGGAVQTPSQNVNRIIKQQINQTRDKTAKIVIIHTNFADKIVENKFYLYRDNITKQFRYQFSNDFNYSHTELYI